MQIEVDFGRCDSNGLCAELAPQVFHLDEQDMLHVLAEHPAEAHWPAVEEAVRACPKIAITVRDAR
jgi:ferredoxin